MTGIAIPGIGLFDSHGIVAADALLMVSAHKPGRKASDPSTVRPWQLLHAGGFSIDGLLWWQPWHRVPFSL